MVKRSVESDDGDKKAELEQPIENVMLIDFQYACWSSPVIDLHYFLNTSLQESLRPNRFDELIDFYHGNLVETLKRLRYKKPIPTLEQLKQQYLDKSFYGKDFGREFFLSLKYFNQFLCSNFFIS